MRNSVSFGICVHRQCSPGANIRVGGALIVALPIALMAAPAWAQDNNVVDKPAVASDTTALVNQPTDSKQAAVVSASGLAVTAETAPAVGGKSAGNPDLDAASAGAAVARAPATPATTDPLPARVDLAVAPQATLVPQDSAAVSKAAAPAAATASTAATAKPAAAPAPASEIDGPAQ